MSIVLSLLHGEWEKGMTLSLEGRIKRQYTLNCINLSLNKTGCDQFPDQDLGWFGFGLT